MHPSDRSGHGRRRPSGFPSPFPDPFAGFGMLGGSGFFDDFFSSNPFDDPFFSRPFGSAFAPFSSPFGPLPGSMAHSGLLEPDGFFRRSNGGFLDERPFHPPPAEGRRGPVIEELPDDHETPESNTRHDQQPIVEHPDDEVGSAGTTRPATNHLRQSQTPSSRDYLSNRGYQSNSGHQSFSYQSSSVTYGGTGGTYYSSSSMRRVGPDGVMEEEHTERDASGKETKMAARGLRDKVHAVTKKRTATGPESTVETLHNLTPEETPHFDAQWEAHAQRSLPGRNRVSRMLEGIGTRPAQRQPALQYNEGSQHAWPDARRA